MAHEKHVDLPDDFDAVLRRTMSVSPSAAFLPGVRERIAAQPRRFSWWSLALITGPAVAGALVLVLWATSTPAPVVPSTASVASAPHTGVSESAPATVPLPEAKPAALSRTKRSPHPRRPANVLPGREEPVVVTVDERQRAALAALMRMVGDGRLTDEAFAQTTPQSTEAIREQVRPLSVAPVEVSPIAVGGVLQKGTTTTEPSKAR